MNGLVLLALLALAHGRELKYFEPPSWKCGSNIFEASKDFSYWLVKACPSSSYELVNNCCIKHDECYDNRGGLSECNKQFYKCIDDATDYFFCWPVGKALNWAVRLFGKEAYERSAPDEAIPEVTSRMAIGSAGLESPKSGIATMESGEIGSAGLGSLEVSSNYDSA